MAKRINKKAAAQELVYNAYEAPLKEGRALAKKALKLDPENADAYNYLADTEETIEAAYSNYLKALEAGKKSIGEKGFEELKGHFWGFHETRPFMRAKAGLADCLYEFGKHEEAIQHYQEMLALNPNDNQGIRYQLAVCLVEQNRKEYLQLYERFEGDISALWKYTYALYLFKKEGPSSKANKALLEAYQANSLVPSFFMGEKKLPGYMPAYIGIGDENEAIACVYDSGRMWEQAEGAFMWLLNFYKKRKKIN